MILLILLGLTFFIQLLAAPWFVMVETAGSNGKLLKYRLLCMGIFIADTLLCGAIAKAHTHVYFILIGVGMVASFIAGILITKLKTMVKKVFLYCSPLQIFCTLRLLFISYIPYFKSKTKNLFQPLSL